MFNQVGYLLLTINHVLAYTKPGGVLTINHVLA